MTLNLLKSEAPTMSVIMACYNGEPYILRAIESIRKTGSANTEVVIVDDGSTDNSLQIVQEYAAQCPEIQIKIYSHLGGENKGTAATRNLGMERATGKYLAFLDQDDVFFENRFETCIPLLESEPEVDAVLEPFIYFFPNPGQPQRIREIVEIDDFVTRKNRLAKRSENLFRDLLNGSLNVHTSSLTIRRVVALSLGGFPKIHYTEDLAFLFKVICSDKAKQGTLKPVSGYFIHELAYCSKNIDSPEFAFAPIKAMIFASKWITRNTSNKSYGDILRAAIVQKYFHYCSKLPRLSRSLLKDFIRYTIPVTVSVPLLVIQKQFWKVVLKTIGVRFGLSQPWKV